MAAPRDQQDFELIIGDSFNPKKSEIADITQCKFNFIPQSLDNTGEGQLKFEQRRPKLSFNNEYEFLGAPGEKPKETECILIFNHDTNQVTIERLSHTLNFTSYSRIGTGNKRPAQNVSVVTGKNDFKDRNKSSKSDQKKKDKKMKKNREEQKLFQNQEVHQPGNNHGKVMPDIKTQHNDSSDDSDTNIEASSQNVNSKDIINSISHNIQDLSSDEESSNVQSDNGEQTPNLMNILDDVAADSSITNQTIDSTLPMMDGSDISKLVFGQSREQDRPQQLPATSLSDSSDEDDSTTDIDSPAGNIGADLGLGSLGGDMQNFMQNASQNLGNNSTYSGPSLASKEVSQIMPQMSVRTKKVIEDLEMSDSDADSEVSADMM